jgi:hypothetical protein
MESPKRDSKIVLILDALDECGSAKDREALLEALADKSAQLPPTFQLVITSRPDKQI